MGGAAGFDRHENLNGGTKYCGPANKFILQVSLLMALKIDACLQLLDH